MARKDRKRKKSRMKTLSRIEQKVFLIKRNKYKEQALLLIIFIISPLIKILKYLFGDEPIRLAYQILFCNISTEIIQRSHFMPV